MELDDDFEPQMDISALGEPMIKLEPTLYPPTLWQEVERFFEYNALAFVIYLSLGFLAFTLPLLYPVFFSRSHGAVITYVLTFGSIFGSLFYSTSGRVSRFR